MRAHPVHLVTHSAPTSRWRSIRDLLLWQAAFTAYFPRKGHLSDSVASRLESAHNIGELHQRIGMAVAPAALTDAEDRLYAQRRMQRFKEDRLVLIHDFRILPDAANQFLTQHPVGSSRPVRIDKRWHLVNETKCFYEEHSRPGQSIDAIVDSQYEEALAQQWIRISDSGRLNGYLPGQVIAGLSKSLGFEFTPDHDGNDALPASVPATRAGWIRDSELGEVECVALGFTGHPDWCRDEVFYSVLMALRRSRDVNDRPIVLWNNRAHQLVHRGKVYTSFGWIVIGRNVIPFLTGRRGLSFADVLVETVTFNRDDSYLLIDNCSELFRSHWGAVHQQWGDQVPESPVLLAMPDDWMVGGG